MMSCPSSAAGFIDSTSSDVTNPFNDVVITVVQFGLKHLQVPHLQTRGGKGHLGEELDTN